MRSNYEVIIESYYSMQKDLGYELNLLSIATEAADTTAQATGQAKQDDPSNSPTSSEMSGKPTQKAKAKVVEFIRKIIEKITAWITKARAFITNRFKQLLISDKQFLKTLHSRRGEVKPLEGFEVMNYQYNNQWLDMTFNKISNEILQTLNLASNIHTTGSGRPAEILAAEPSNIASVLLQQYSDSKESISVNSFCKEMTNKFRGEKQEIKYSQSQIGELMNSYTSAGNLKSAIDSQSNKIQSSLNNLKRMEHMAQFNGSDNDMDEISKRVNKASSLYNIHLTIMKMYYELKLEHALSCKMLLRKFYQF